MAHLVCQPGIGKQFLVDVGQVRIGHDCIGRQLSAISQRHALSTRTVHINPRHFSVELKPHTGLPRDSHERIDHVFELNMGIFRFKFTMNFLMNVSTQLQIIGALLVGGWSVYTEQLEIGGVVAFISGIGRITDPWGDLVNYFRDVNITQVKFRLLSEALNQQARRDSPKKT